MLLQLWRTCMVINVCVCICKQHSFLRGGKKRIRVTLLFVILESRGSVHYQNFNSLSKDNLLINKMKINNVFSFLY